jgi:hypothetical protein
MPDTSPAIALIPHPLTAAPQVRALDVRATWTAADGLQISYRLWGDIARLRVPDDQPARRADQLWEHTCFEAFVALPGSQAYREFNFSPAGLWASYDFSVYRQRADMGDTTAGEMVAPQIVTRRYAGRLEVDATLAASVLPAGMEALDVGLCAVVEAADAVDGHHSYWALAHGAARPDFHLRESFTLRIARA